MIANLARAGATVSVVDVGTPEDAAWWHAMGATHAQGDFTGEPGDLDTLMGERSAPSVNGA